MLKHNPIAKAITFGEDGRRDVVTRLLDGDCICLANYAAERVLRGIALGRKAWLFAGSPRGGDRVASIYSIIVTANMNDVDRQVCLADVVARPPDIHPSHLSELLPLNGKRPPIAKAA